MIFFEPNIEKMQAEQDAKGLIKLLKHSKTYLRFGAVRALGELHSTQAVEPLIQALGQAPDFLEMDNIIEALGKIGDRRAVPPVLECLNRVTDQELYQWKKMITDYYFEFEQAYPGHEFCCYEHISIVFQSETILFPFSKLFLWHSIFIWLRRMYAPQPDHPYDGSRNYKTGVVIQRIEEYGRLHGAVFSALAQIGDPNVRYLIDQAKAARYHHMNMCDRIHGTAYKSEVQKILGRNRMAQGLQPETDLDEALYKQYVGIFVIPLASRL